ncbi:hypothetical protein, partial [Vibrio anguillarum]
MDVLDLIEKLKGILASSERDSLTVLEAHNSPLLIDARFEASRLVELTSLRTQLTHLVSDLE